MNNALPDIVTFATILGTSRNGKVSRDAAIMAAT